MRATKKKIGKGRRKPAPYIAAAAAAAEPAATRLDSTRYRYNANPGASRAKRGKFTMQLAAERPAAAGPPARFNVDSHRYYGYVIARYSCPPPPLPSPAPPRKCARHRVSPIVPIIRSESGERGRSESTAATAAANDLNSRLKMKRVEKYSREKRP